MSEQEIYIEAMNRQDSAERRRFLDEACADDGALRDRVEKLIRHTDRVGSFLAKPAGLLEGLLDDRSAAATASTASTTHIVEKLGTRIGPYKLLQQIGEGGFGVVYMAEQTRPVRRKIALKIVKPGMDTKEVIARFEAERQALALMDHPNVAKVLDAGATDSGRPYFVMELVHGVPITEFCDDQKLSTPERLELFVNVCRAVQHAHQKGIIHRDLKPSNILITMDDDCPLPKVIDFGIAKALSQQLTEKTLFTAYGQMLGTPMYMSPEQAQFSAHDVDTRSDVYSLGVLLYELLTDSTPFDKETLQKSGFDEMRRMICDVAPPRPSTRISTLSAERLSTVSTRRKTDPRQLGKSLRRELDWIVMRAMEKDRARRYESAAAFAADVKRYLSDEQVQACPPSVRYRVKKFVRRNRGPVLTASLVLLALVAGIAGTTWGLIRAETARRSETARADGERQAKQEAETREAETNAVFDFVEDKIFAAARPEGQEGGLGSHVSLRRAIEEALPYVETSFKDQPLIEARLRNTVAKSFFHLGEAKIALKQYEKALAVFVQRRGPGDPGTLTSRNGLANCYNDLGRYMEALKIAEETLALRNAKLGPDHIDTLRSMNTLGNTYALLYRHPEALKIRQESLDLKKAKLGPLHLETLKSMGQIASSYFQLGRNAEGIVQAEKTLELMQAQNGLDHPSPLSTMNVLAGLYLNVGRHDEALKLFKKTLELKKDKLGPSHPSTLASINNLAVAYSKLGQPTEALNLHKETLKLMKEELGPVHSNTLQSMRSLANAYRESGQLTEALKLSERALELTKEKLDSHPSDILAIMTSLALAYRESGQLTAALKLHEETVALKKANPELGRVDRVGDMANLASAYDALGQKDEALKLREESLAIHRATSGPDHPNTMSMMNNLAVSYLAVGRFDEALEFCEQALAAQKSKLGDLHPDTLKTMNNLANAYFALGRTTESLELRKKNLSQTKAKLGPDHPGTLISMHNLASSYYSLGEHAKALQLLEQTLALRKVTLGPNHPKTLASMQGLAVSYSALDRHAEALSLQEQTLALRKDKLGPDHPDTLSSMNSLADVYRTLGRHAEALKFREETLTRLKAKFGPTHPATLRTMNDLAQSYFDHGRHIESLELCEQTFVLKKVNLGPDHPDTLRSMGNLAISYHELARHAEGLQLQENHLKLVKVKRGPHHRDTLVSMYSLSSSYFHVGRKDEALKLHEQTLTLMKTHLGLDHTTTLKVMYSLAISYADEFARYVEARELRAQTLELQRAKLGADHPDTLDSMNYLAKLLASCPDPQVRDHVRAVELAQQAVELRPNAGDFWNTLGVALYRSGQHGPAIEAIQKSFKLGSRGDSFVLAMAFWQSDDKKQARRCYEDGVASMYPSGQTSIELGQIGNEAEALMGLSPEERITAVIAHWSRKIEQNPDEWRMHGIRGNLFFDRRQWAECVGDFELVLQETPDDLIVRLNLAWAFQCLGHHDKVIEQCGAVITLEPQNWTAYSRRGQAYMLKKEYKQAVVDFDKAVQYSPKSPWPYRHRAEVHAQLENWAAAAADFEEFYKLGRVVITEWPKTAILKLHVEDTKGYRNFCQTIFARWEQEKNETWQEALINCCLFGPNALPNLQPIVVLAEQSLKQDPRDPDRLRELGAAYYRAGRFPEAIEQFDAGLTLTPGSVRGSLWMAMTQHKTGNASEATHWLNKAAESFDRNRPESWSDRLELELLRKEAEVLIDVGNEE